MKNLTFQLFVAVLLMAAPAMAQDFRSTSTMRSTGSAYSPQVSPVGSMQPTPVTPVTGTLPMTSRQRAAQEDEISGDFDKPGYETDPESPIGEPWILFAFVAAACGIVYLRKRKAQKTETR